jgi:hypothetical protein
VEHEHLSNAFGNREADFVPMHFDPPAPAVPKGGRRYTPRMMIEVGIFITVVVVVSVVAIVKGK